MKTQIAFEVDKALLEIIKEKAKAEKRSLNNYIEYLLYKDVVNIPNNETIEAIKEARSEKKTEEITDLSSWLDKI